MSFRAFISVDLEPSDKVLEFCDDLRGADAALKVVRAELLHVTLKFLGDIQEPMVPRIVDAMRASVEGVEPMRVELRGVGAFPSFSSIRVVWIGLRGAEGLCRVAGSLEDGLSELGFRREKRDFSPHLTVARAKGSKGMGRVKDLLERWEGTSFGEQEVEWVRLKRSILGPKGPTYHTVAEAHLKASH